MNNNEIVDEFNRLIDNKYKNSLLYNGKLCVSIHNASFVHLSASWGTPNRITKDIVIPISIIKCAYPAEQYMIDSILGIFVVNVNDIGGKV